MGLDFSTAEFLYSNAKRGISLGRLLVLGRQLVHMTSQQTDKVKHWTGLRLQPAGFADDFFRALGATSISFLDYSDYEGADVLHDLNQPLASQLHGRFDTVIDGGTLEHVFNFPIALKSCMEAVNEGGRLMIFTPANNQMGHGFYQFSPELFYRALSPNYGFEVERLLLRHAGLWYEANDPAVIRAHAEAATPKPASIFVSALRTRSVSVFEPWPIQSDYPAQWSKLKRASGTGMPSMKDRLVSQFPVLAEIQLSWRSFKDAKARRLWRLSNRSFFRKIGASLL